MKLTSIALLILTTILVVAQDTPSPKPKSQQGTPVKPSPTPPVFAGLEIKRPTLYEDIERVRLVQVEFKKADRYEDVEIKVIGDRESSGFLNIKSKNPIPVSDGGPSPQTYGYSVDLSLLRVPDELVNYIISAIFSRKPDNSAGSLEGVKVKQVGASANYEVAEDYSYQYGPNKITIPKGFVYDRASIPRVFWVLIDKDSLSNVAPLFHDFLYRNGGKLEQRLVAPYRTFSRDDTDELFLELMTKCGVAEWRREAAYQAVRSFSGSFWKDQ